MVENIQDFIDKKPLFLGTEIENIVNSKLGDNYNYTVNVNKKNRFGKLITSYLISVYNIINSQRIILI